MGKIRLALLSGGISSEREVSLNSGNQVYETLNKDKYDITRYDPKTDIARLVADASNIDAALIILHGPFGEDGAIQGLLDFLNIPYQGSGVLGSSIAMNKLATKRLYHEAGIPSPLYQTFASSDKIETENIIRSMGLPLVVKPANAGSSMGLSIPKSVEELDKAIKQAFQHDSTILIEVYIEGRELTCGVLGNEPVEPLSVVEIIPGKGHKYFDYQAKYIAGESEEICPARIDEDITFQIQKLSVMAHKSLFLKGYSRTDFILKGGSEIYVLETNTIPGMTATSLYPQSALAGGYSFSKLLDKLIELSIEENKLTNLKKI